MVCAHHVGHLDEASVVLLVQRPEDAPLHRLEAVGQIGNGAVADDIGGVIEKAAVHSAVQRLLDLTGDERARGSRHGHAFGEHVSLPVAALCGLGLGLFAVAVLGHRRGVHHSGCAVGHWLNRQFRLIGSVVLAFGRHRKQRQHRHTGGQGSTRQSVPRISVSTLLLRPKSLRQRKVGLRCRIIRL